MDTLSIAREIRRRIRPVGAAARHTPPPADEELDEEEPDEELPDFGAERTPLAFGGRGRMLSAKFISAELYGGDRSVWWVNHNFAPEYKISQGKRTFWWEADALLWLDRQRACERRKAG